MGLFARLFGKKQQEDPRKREVLACARQTASQPYCGEADLEKIRTCFPDPKDFDLKLDAVNNLFELDHNDWAEALALDIAHDEDVPLTILKGLVRHFVDSGRLAEVLEPMEWLVDERPSETDMALMLGRHLVRKNEYERCIEDMERPLASAPESRHLFALLGECHFRLKKWEDAVIHLRTSCELYEQAFRLHQVLPDEMTNEQFEYTRLYGMLEDAARKHYGEEKMAEAFENITMEPSSFGLMKEAEELAVQRIEYKPPSLELLSLGDLASCCKEMEADEDKASCRKYYEAQRVLREGKYGEAMKLFREALQLDLEDYGSYFGWAACENLQRVDPFPEGVSPLPPEQTEALESIFSDWPAMSASERKIAAAALAPIGGFLPAMAEAGAKIHVHPLDVRLKDLYPERTEIRFEFEDKPPQAIPAFAAKLTTHLRLDEFLHVRPEHFTLARMAGYLVADTLEKNGGKQLNEAKNIMKKVKGLLGGTQRVVNNLDDFLATALELLACVRLFGDPARNEYEENFEKAGAFDFLESLK